MAPSIDDKEVSSGKVLLILTTMALACAADTMALNVTCEAPPTEVSGAVPADFTGKLIVLPGSANTKYHLAGFVELATRQLPGFDIELRPWGIPFLVVQNIRAHERNVATARQMAGEIVQWRRDHPDELLYLFGYSGGAGLAAMIVSELPDDVIVDRLVLMASAVSPDFPMEERVLPRVREFAVNYASTADVQMGWGTRTFGTIDRVNSTGAGSRGFDTADPRLVQWHWTASDRAWGHRGNHRSYLGPRWQSVFLLPALDPGLTADDVRARWVRLCEAR